MRPRRPYPNTRTQGVATSPRRSTRPSVLSLSVSLVYSSTFSLSRCQHREGLVLAHLCLEVGDGRARRPLKLEGLIHVVKYRTHFGGGLQLLWLANQSALALSGRFARFPERTFPKTYDSMHFSSVRCSWDAVCPLRRCRNFLGKCLCLKS